MLSVFLPMLQSLRIWQRQPSFAVAAIIALGLAIAANCTLFTVINALLLKPLPFDHAEQLVELSLSERALRLEEVASAQSLELRGAILGWSFPVKSAGGTRNIYGVRATADLVPLLRVRALVGRALTRDDVGRKTLMIGYDYWRQLGGRPDILGQSLTIEGEVWSIAGVLPADFFLSTRDTNLIVPDLQAAGRTLARLRPGITTAQAQAEISKLAGANRIHVVPLDRAFRSSDSNMIVLLQATAAFVLMITCANLANLQLVRGVSRRREFAIRSALGASRLNLIIQLTRESLPLALGGAASGLVMTWLLHDAALAALPVNISRRLSGEDALGIDSRVMIFTLGIAVITVLLFGLLPALHSLRFDVMSRLRDSAKGMSRERQRFGQLLVIVEIALALMLLTGASLTFKNLTQLETRHLGFSPSGVLSGLTSFSPVRYPRPEQKAALFKEIERRLSAIPGVAHVGIVAPQVYPFGGPAVRGAHFEIFGQPGADPRAEVYFANPSYLDAIRLPLLRGRWFNDSDTLASPPVAVLSDVVARRYWGDEDPIGHRLRLESDRAESPWVTIVGVVGDVKNPVAVQWQPTAYRPFAQAPKSGAALMIRAAVPDPKSLAPAIRRELQTIDPTAPELGMAANLDTAIVDYVSPQRFTTRLMAVFAIVGLALATAGVYGVMRYWVASRTGEIGIRVALGAQHGDVLGLVLGRAMWSALAGVVMGLSGAIALRKVMAAQLVSVSAVDPVVLSSVAGVILAVSVLAAWSPARRASRIDPAEALREE